MSIKDLSTATQKVIHDAAIRVSNSCTGIPDDYSCNRLTDLLKLSLTDQTVTTFRLSMKELQVQFIDEFGEIISGYLNCNQELVKEYARFHSFINAIMIQCDQEQNDTARHVIRQHWMQFIASQCKVK